MGVIFYLSSIVVANWMVYVFGVVTFCGLSFPAGTVVIGLTFSARDFVQKKHGKWGCWKFTGIALFITLLMNRNLALASASAFIVSEFIDWFIFTYSKRPFGQRVILSNLFSTPIDSALFVIVAFGWSWPAIWGQTIIKFLSSILFLLLTSIKKAL